MQPLTPGMESRIESGRGGRLLSSASLTLATRIAAFGFSLITNVILARSLGPEGRGIYAVAVVIPAIISLVAQLGIGSANVYYLSKRLIDLDELIGHSMSFASVLGTLCFVLVFAYVRLANSSQFLGIGSQYVLVSCLALPFILLTGFLLSILQGGERFAQFNLVLLLQYATPTVALVIAVVLLHGRTLGAVAAWAASSVVSGLAAVLLVAPLRRISFRLRSETIRPLLRFGLVSYLGSLSSFVNYRFDVFLVNLFSGARQVGLYAVGTGLAEIVWYVANAAGIVLAPRVASSDPHEADRITEAVGRVVAFLAVFAAAVLAATAPFVVVIFFGAAFAESAWAVWFLLPGIVTFSVGRILSMYLLGRNRLKVDLLASFIGLVVTLALDLLLIPKYGFRGAAIASSVAYTSAMLVDLVWVIRNSTISLRALLVARPADAFLVWTGMKQMAALIRRPVA